MGLIIIPYLFVVLMFFVTALVLLIIGMARKQVGRRHFFEGILYPILSYSLTFLYCMSVGRISVWAPLFLFPVYMVVVPTGVGLALIPFRDFPKVDRFKYSFFIGAIISGILLVLIEQPTEDWLDYMGVDKYF